MLELYTDAVRSMLRTNLPVEDAFMFGHRLQMAMDAPDLAKVYDVVLMERSFLDHLAFIEAFASTGQIPSYLVDWSRKVVQEVAPPVADRYIFLEVTAEMACRRRTQRGSSGSEVFNLEFMSALKEAYDRLIPQYYDQPLIFDWSKYGDQLSIDDLLSQFVPPVSVRVSEAW